MKALFDFFFRHRLARQTGLARLRLKQHGLPAAEWQPEDAVRWRTFLNTPTGQRVRTQLLFNTTQAEASAIHVARGGAFEAGLAAGWGCATAHLFTLSEPSAPHEMDTPEFVVAESGGGLDDRDS